MGDTTVDLAGWKLVSESRRSACRSSSAGSTPTVSTRCTSRRRIADLAPGCVDGLRVIPSPYGHDGFLVEREQVFDLVAETLELADEVAA